MREIFGKKALVTGAASGIGRSIALALAREGAALFLLDIRGRKLDAVVSEARALGVEAMGRECDLTDPEGVAKAINELLEAWGGLDILVNNAGVLYYGRTEDMRSEQWEEVLSVNLLAPVRLVRRLLPVMLERSEAHIVNVSSLGGLIPRRHFAAYQTAKFGLVGFGESLRREYARRGIGVTTLCPGLVETGLVEAARERGWITSRLKLGAYGSVSPDRVAAIALGAIRAKRGLVVMPAHARLLWLLHRAFPRLLGG